MTGLYSQFRCTHKPRPAGDVDGCALALCGFHNQFGWSPHIVSLSDDEGLFKPPSEIPQETSKRRRRGPRGGIFTDSPGRESISRMCEHNASWIAASISVSERGNFEGLGRHDRAPHAMIASGCLARLRRASRQWVRAMSTTPFSAPGRGGCGRCARHGL